MSLFTKELIKIAVSRNISKKPVISQHFNILIFSLTIILSLFGIVAVYSATRSLGTNTQVIVQSASLVLGTALLIAVCFFDYEQFKGLVKPIYIFAIAILVLVLVIGVGGESWGAKSWIRIGAIGIQPSELAKICFILTFSYHLSEVTEDINKPLKLLGLIAHLSLIVLLIMLQPDLGSVLVFIFMFAVLLFTAKLSYKYILPVLALAIISVPLAYKYVLSDYQQQRINVFLNPDLDPLNRGYNVIQSKLAVGSGQVWGEGFLKGIQNRMGFLPAKYTDFIFSTISEEWGFIGSVLLVFALFLLVYKCFKVAQRADNLYGKYIATGVGAMFLFHLFENVGMCIGLTPVTGIPLPFISYGGSSLITNMLAVGLVMSVDYHNKPRSTIEVY
ncbi:MAG: rod shape-determining protein RodA [Clostridia bacterium]|nr:rod shape-determining protein RodA [Clostridia bacterium]